MFGIFKKKKKTNDKEKFVLELAHFASEFKDHLGEIEDEIMHRALDIYLEQNPEESEYTASDFYLNSFIGAVGQATIQKNIQLGVSLNYFSLTDSFLRGSGKYQTKVALNIMDNWQTVLSRMGAF